MNKFHRKGTTVPRRSYCRKPGVKIKEASDIEVLHSPPTTGLKRKGKNVANRCCYANPFNRDLGHSPTISPKYSKEDFVNKRHDSEQVSSLRKNKYFCEPAISNITHLKELQRTSQTSDHIPKSAAVSNESCWQKVEDCHDVDKILLGSESIGTQSYSKHIFVSEVPRVKVIAQKFSKYKRGNLELRRLDEKVVCVEYDIYSQSTNDQILKVAQRMRAFFSIKPYDNDNSENQGIPPNIKNEFEVLDEDLEKLTDKEIEFIDDTIEENKSYLKDLRRILKRKQVINAQKNKSSLDLQSLYEMAKRDRRLLHCDISGVNLLSPAQLKEVKDLILQRCTSSAHGFRRRKIKQKERDLSPDVGVISESIMTELVAITKTLNV